MASPLLGVALAALLLGVASSSPKKKTSPKKLLSGNKLNTPNSHGLVGCDPYHTPSGNTAPYAVPGFATHPDYQWCYIVRDGDSAGSITEMFFGPSEGWRYAELLAANPQKATKGTTVSPDGSDNELNFASMTVGETLYLPRTWNSHIDQTGVPRTKVMPSGLVA